MIQNYNVCWCVPSKFHTETGNKFVLAISESRSLRFRLCSISVILLRKTLSGLSHPSTGQPVSVCLIPSSRLSTPLVKPSTD